MLDLILSERTGTVTRLSLTTSYHPVLMPCRHRVFHWSHTPCKKFHDIFAPLNAIFMDLLMISLPVLLILFSRSAIIKFIPSCILKALNLHHGETIFVRPPGDIKLHAGNEMTLLALPRPLFLSTQPTVKQSRIIVWIQEAWM